MATEPGGSAVHTNSLVTDIAIAHKSTEAVLSGNLFPSVPRKHMSNKFKVFDEVSFHKNFARKLGRGEPAPRFGFKATEQTYACERYGFADEIDDDDRDDQDPIMQLEARKTRRVVDQVVTIKEIKIAEAVKNYNWAGISHTHTVSNKWDAGSGVPITDIRTAILTIHQATGLDSTAMTMTLPWEAMFVLMIDPTLREYIKYTGGGSMDEPNIVTEQTLRSFFRLGKVIVTSPTYITSDLDEDPVVRTNIMGNDVFIGAPAPQPSIDFPSVGYVFEWKGRRAKMWREEDNARDVVRVLDWFDARIVWPKSGYLIKTVLTA